MGESRRSGDLSDGEIQTRLDTITGQLGEMKLGMATWRDEVVAKDVYAADERFRAEQHDNQTAANERLALEVVDLKAEAARRARERRQLWSAVMVALIGAVAAVVISYTSNHKVPSCQAPQLVNSHVVCQLP